MEDWEIYAEHQGAIDRDDWRDEVSIIKFEKGKRMIKLIAAVDANWGLGYENELLFKIPEDMKRFRKLTEGDFVVMGRKTYESLPEALKNRRNVVMTNDKAYKVSDINVLIEHDISKVIDYYTETGTQELDLWVIGGAEIYRAFIGYADELWITHVGLEVEHVDTWFPFEGLDKFKSVRAEIEFDEALDCPVTYVQYLRVGGE